MKLNYIFHRKNHDIEAFLYKDIQKSIDMYNKKNILIVPEQTTLSTERSFIEFSKEKGIINLEIMSFKSLVNKIIEELGARKKDPLSEIGRLMLIKKVFYENKDNLSVYASMSRKNGFITEFSDLISELKRADITPEKLKESSEKENISQVFKKKIEDIAMIYSSYEKYMEGSYADEDSIIIEIVDKIKDSKFLREANVWIHGFTGLTNLELKITEEIIKRASKTSITVLGILNNTRDYDLFETSKITYRKLREYAKENDIEEEYHTISDLKLKSKEIQHIEQEIYSYPFNRYEELPNNIKIDKYLNQNEEVRGICEEIYNKVKNEGYRWRDITIITSDILSYGPIIKRTFAEYKIPFFMDEKRSISTNPLIKFITSALKICAWNFKHEDVFRFLKTGFVDFKFEEIEILENYCLRYGIKEKKWFENFKIEDDKYEELEILRERLMIKFEKFYKSMTKKSTVEKFTLELYKFMESFKLKEKLEDWVYELKEQEEIEYAMENAQIWNVVVKNMEELVEIIGNEKITLKEYLELIETSFLEYKMGLIPSTLDQVIVGDFIRSKYFETKSVFILGVNDGVLPSKLIDKGIILDDEKLLLQETGLDIRTDSISKMNDERLKIYEVMSTPIEALNLSYVISDLEGKSMRPSILISRLKSIFPKMEVESHISSISSNVKIYSPTSAISGMVSALRNGVDKGEFSEKWLHVYKWYLNSDEYKHYANAIEKGLFYSNLEESIDNEISKKLYESPFKSSISRFEEYVKCPYSHFIKYGIRATERKEYKLNIPDIGRLFHESVDKFAIKVREERRSLKSIKKAESNKLAEEIVDDIIQGFDYDILSSSHRYRYLSNKLKRVTKRAVWTMVKHSKQGKFEIMGTEVPFGEEHPYSVPPLIIEMPNKEKVYLRGRIDRVDVFKDGKKAYVNIIDYKSSDKRLEVSDVYYGLQIQLLAYLDVMMKNKDYFKVDELHPSGVFYFKIDDPMINTEEIDEEFIEKEIVKKLKMNGLVVNDINVIKNIDEEIEEKLESDVIKVSLTKKGEISKKSDILSEPDLTLLMEHIRAIIGEMAYEILKGNIEIKPCKTNNMTACDYCEYSAICQFDITIPGNEYRKMSKLKTDEVMDKLKEKYLSKEGEKDA